MLLVQLDSWRLWAAGRRRVTRPKTGQPSIGPWSNADHFCFGLMRRLQINRAFNKPIAMRPYKHAFQSKCCSVCCWGKPQVLWKACWNWSGWIGRYLTSVPCVGVKRRCLLPFHIKEQGNRRTFWQTVLHQRGGWRRVEYPQVWRIKTSPLAQDTYWCWRANTWNSHNRGDEQQHWRCAYIPWLIQPNSTWRGDHKRHSGRCIRYTQMPRCHCGSQCTCGHFTP